MGPPAVEVDQPQQVQMALMAVEAGPVMEVMEALELLIVSVEVPFTIVPAAVEEMEDQAVPARLARMEQDGLTLIT
jgi:hypothetical protein